MCSSDLFCAAIEFIKEIGFANVILHEQELLAYATEKMAALPFVRLIGTAKDKVGVLSFILEGIHCFDVGQMLDAYGIAVRTGHHCTQPLMQRLGLEGTVRASVGIYTTLTEIDALIDGLRKVIRYLK